MIACGELEDVRPCDSCGHDYVFVIGEDPGTCARCRRDEQIVAEARRAAERELALLDRQTRAARLAASGLRWVLYRPNYSSAPKWHLVSDAQLEDGRRPTVCSQRLEAERLMKSERGRRPCVHCRAFAQRQDLGGPPR